MKRLALVLLLVFSGCDNAEKMNRLSVGMTKQEVKSVLGSPKTSSASDGFEYWKFFLADEKQRWVTGGFGDYMVKFKDGKVVAYGKEDEFAPTQNINMKIKKK